MFRPLLLATLALAVPVAPVSAHAAARPVCKLVVDAKSDEKPIPDGSLDIQSADLASDAKRITAVIRLAGAPSGTDTFAPSGRVYTIQFFGQGAEHPVFFTYVIAPTASAAVYGHFDPATGINTGDGEATYKVVGNEVRMTTSVGSFSSYGKFKPKAKITQITVTTGRMLGVFADTSTYGYNTQVADQASGEKSYTAGSKSCVKVGG